MDLETARKISILQDLVRIESVNDHEAAVASYLATLFDPYRDRVTIERVPYAADRDNLVVTMGNPAGRHLGISGHMDVVDPVTWRLGPTIHLVVKWSMIGCTAAVRQI